jgi:dihydrofolate reductase
VSAALPILPEPTGAAAAPALTLIAAVDRARGIGRQGGLLVHLKEDLQHFKRTTIGAPVIMGRRTWDSLPARARPLPGRRNLVLTRDASWQADGAERAGSLDAALDRLHGQAQAFVIGGAELYALALPRARTLLLTEIDARFEADAFFPEVDRTLFEEVAREPQVGESGVRFDFVTYRRRSGPP